MSMANPNWTQPKDGMLESWAQAYQLAGTRDRQLWTGNGWSPITGVAVPKNGDPIIYCGKVGYKVPYLTAVRYRRPWSQAA